MACSSEEAAKQSQSAGKEILPIAVGFLLVLVLVLTMAVNRPGPVRNFYNRFETRIMVRGMSMIQPFCPIS